MLAHLIRVAKTSAVYSLGSLAEKGIGFFLVPMYTRYLTPEDYGVLAMLGAVVAPMAVIAGLGVSSGLTMSYNQEYDDNEQERRRAVGTVLAITAISGTALLAVILILSTTFSNLFFSTPIYSTCFKLMGIAMFLETLLAVGLLVLRIQERAVRYVSVVLFKFVVGIGLNILLLVGFKWGIQGVLVSAIISSLLAWLYIGIKLTWEIKPKVSLMQFKIMFLFGFPIMFSGIIHQVMSLSDRYFIQFMVGSTELGLYSLGSRFGMIVSALVIMPFILAWGPFAWAVYREPNALETYARTTTYYLLVAGGVALVISALAREAIQIMATPDFYSAYRVVPFIALAWVIHGLVNMAALGMALAKKTWWMPIIVAIATVTNLGLNFLLVPMWGMVGAAIATAVAFSILPTGLVLVSRRYIKVPYEWARLSKIALSIGVVFGITQLVNMDAAYINAIIKGMILLTLPVVLYITGFFQQDELQKVKDRIRRTMK